jgi:hypothetical protein
LKDFQACLATFRKIFPTRKKGGTAIAKLRGNMKMRSLCLAACLLALAISEASAQTGIRPPRGLSLGIMGGAAAFSDMQRGSLEVSRSGSAGVETRDLGRRIGAETSTVLGAYLSFWPNRNWGLRLAGTYAPTRFETIMRSSHEDFLGTAADTGRLAGLDVTTADVQLMFRLPTIKNRVLLYGMMGGGVARYETRGGEPVPDEAAADLGGGPQTHPAGMFGLGAMLPFRNRAFRLHFELTDHVSETPIARVDGVDEDPVELTNSVRFTIGVSWSPNR